METVLIRRSDSLTLGYDKGGDTVTMSGEGVAALFYMTAESHGVSPASDGDAQTFIADGKVYRLHNDNLQVSRV